MSVTQTPTIARSPRPIRVVVADDECMFRTCLRQLLAVPPSIVKEVYGSDVGAGFEVIGEAATGQTTVETVQSMKPDLLLLDISMPRMSGLEALRELRRLDQDTRTVILSGMLDKSQLLCVHRTNHCAPASAKASPPLVSRLVPRNRMPSRSREASGPTKAHDTTALWRETSPGGHQRDWHP